MVNENTKNSALRVIDASFNRAMEGLRVVEESARMHLSDAFLSSALKTQRHNLGAAADQLFGDALIHCRDIIHDVGTKVQTETEYRRANLLAIIRANFARTLQSLRSIEEYSKLIAADAGQTMEQIRYEVYGLEKALVNLIQARTDFQQTCLYVLVDTRSDRKSFHQLILELIEAEVDFIQLRDKTLDDRELIDAGKRLTQWTAQTNTRWIMNDRPDLAVLTDADGVHLGQTDMDVPSARRIVGPSKIIGVSTHNFSQAQEAVMNGASYIGVGPVYSSTTKSFETFATPQFIEKVAAEISLPAFAIGGIDETNIENLIRAGVTRFAVSGAVINSDSPGRAAKILRKEIGSSAISI